MRRWTCGDIDDDELLTIIAGTWSDGQAEEFAAMPETLHTALLADHDGRHEEAADIFRQIIAQTDLKTAPRYIYFETAKALLSCGRPAEAVEMLDAFFAAVQEDDDSSE